MAIKFLLVLVLTYSQTYPTVRFKDLESCHVAGVKIIKAMRVNSDANPYLAYSCEARYG